MSIRANYVRQCSILKTYSNATSQVTPLNSLTRILKVSGKKVAIATISLVAFTSSPDISLAIESSTKARSFASANPTETITPVYFGNGCFWGRQKDFFDTELKMGRSREESTAVVGYAGGKGVCYYYSLPDTVYEKLGHAEVVQVALKGNIEKEFKMFADTYFSQFQKTPFGMMRQDPQDRGAGYRNVIGLPGGTDSPLFKILEEANVHGMELRQGQGNFKGKVNEPDAINVVYVVDSKELPFYIAEQYHQYHNGLGKAFPQEYTRGMKKLAQDMGRIGPTGCPEYPF